MKTVKENITSSRISLILATLSPLIALLFGLWYYNSQKNELITQKYSELQAIADYKVDMISTWLKERTNDVRLMRSSPAVAKNLEVLVTNPENAENSTELRDRLDRVKINFGYECLMVMDDLGKILFTTDSVGADKEFLFNKAREIDSTDGMIFTGIYASPHHPGYHLDIIASFNLSGAKTSVYLIFRTDPARRIYPILAKWPTKTETGETFLATTENDSAVFLSPLKYAADAPLKLKQSVHNEEFATIRALKGYEGRFIGHDYRGEEVVAIVDHIPQAKWSFVAKVDVNEVVRDAEKSAILISLTIGLLFFALSISFGFYLTSRNKAHLGEILKAEQELSKLGQEYRTIFYNIGDAVITTDSDGKIKQVNNTAETLTGWSAEQAKGEKIDLVFNIVMEEDRKPLSNLVEAVLKDGVATDLAGFVLLISKSGAEIPVSFGASPIHDLDSNKVTGAVLVFKDQTQIRDREQQLALSEEKFSKAFFTSPDAIMITELDTSKVVEYNQGLLELTGHTDEEVNGNTALNLRLLPSPEYRKRLMDQIVEKGEANNIQIEFNHVDGRRRFGLLSARIIEFKGKKHFLSITRDITERVELEMQLIEAKERAEEANRAKSSFFANMSHELRTPLHGIMGFSEVLTDLVTDEEVLSVVGSIHRSGLRLMGTLNLILDLARVESGKEEIQIEELHLAKVVKEDFESFRAFAEGKGLQFNIVNTNPSVGVVADRRLLGSIVNNLVNNAIKFTLSGEVKIESGSLETDGEKKVYIKVSDSGIGIPAETIELIFEEFRQVSEGYGRLYEGTGLGLSIVKKYVDLLGGTIDVTSEVGKGTVFTITLPGCEIESQVSTIIIHEDEAADEKPILHHHTKRRLLFIEDDDASIWFTTKVLSLKYEVETFTTAEKALAQLDNKSYDAFLLDINLGKGLSGIDFLKKLNELPKYSGIPKVALTAYSMSGQKDIFYNFGFSHYFAKPFTKKELLAFVDSIFDQN